MNVPVTLAQRHDAEEGGEFAYEGRVLLADDDSLVASVFARFLRRLGFDVTIATDGVIADARSREETFDVLVSDVAMPNMTGLELLRAVREREADLPVILMTGSPDVSGAIRAMELGAFRYLQKPLSLHQLGDVVGRAVQTHRTARERRRAMAAEREAGAERCSELAGRFANALDKLWVAYQPIVSWSARSVFAHEALVRTEEITLARPDDLLDAAERLGRVHDLGRAVRGRVARTLRESPPEGALFVNLHPDDLDDEDLYDPEAPLSRFSSRVVLEITERAALNRIVEPMQRMIRLRALGYRIAIDDLGAGYAGLTSFAEFEPEVVKVDMSLVRGVDRSPTKQKLLRSIIELCRDLHIQLVAEGIETADERSAVVGLGGDLCQGFLFARPAPPFVRPTFTS